MYDLPANGITLSLSISARLPLSDYQSSHNSPHEAALYLIHVDMAQKEWRWWHEPLTPGEVTRLTHSEDSTQLWPPGEEGSTALEKPS
jgi:hypothetical protein